MRPATPFLIAILAAPLAAAEPTVSATTPLQDPASKVWVPPSIAGLPLEEIEPATDDELGASYTFAHERKPIAATLYISPAAPLHDGLPAITAVRRELATSLVGIESLASEGHYDYLRLGTVRRSKTSIAATELTVVDMSFTFSFPDEENQRHPDYTSVRAFIACTLYDGHLFKFRYTEPAGTRLMPENRNGDPDSRAADAFAGFIDIFREHALRPHITAAIDAYRDAPFSDEGLVAAAFLFSFADESALATVDLGQGVLDYIGYGAGATDESATRHLLNAYVIGNFAHQFESDTWGDQPDAGRRQVRETYRALREERPAFSLPHLEEATTAAE